MGRDSKTKQQRRGNRDLATAGMPAEKAINADPPVEKPWNTRYLEYARAHERTPERMLEWDRERFPGGKMAGFILWMSGRWQDWAKSVGRKYDGGGMREPLTQADQDAFDTWLKTHVDETTRRIIVPRPAEIVRTR